MEQAVAAERADFDGIASSDHLHPWWEGGQSGAAWPTLERLNPERMFLGIGSGEALDEVPAGDDWHPPVDLGLRVQPAGGRGRRPAR